MTRPADHLFEQDRLIKSAATALKVPPSEVVARVESLVEEVRAMKEKLSEARSRIGTGAFNWSDHVELVNGVRFIGMVFRS
jgi:alanyl-tRNA synthetase